MDYSTRKTIESLRTARGIERLSRCASEAHIERAGARLRASEAERELVRVLVPAPRAVRAALFPVSTTLRHLLDVKARCDIAFCAMSLEGCDIIAAACDALEEMLEEDGVAVL